jgi:hypothetical protein
VVEVVADRLKISRFHCFPGANLNLARVARPKIGKSLNPLWVTIRASYASSASPLTGRVFGGSLFLWALP